MNIRINSGLGWGSPETRPLWESTSLFFGLLTTLNPVFDILLLRCRVSPSRLRFKRQVQEVYALQTQVVGSFLEPDALLLCPLELFDTALRSTTSKQHRRRGPQENYSVAVRVRVDTHPTFCVETLGDARVQERHVHVTTLPHVCISVQGTHLSLTKDQKVVAFALSLTVVTSIPFRSQSIQCLGVITDCVYRLCDCLVVGLFRGGGGGPCLGVVTHPHSLIGCFTRCLLSVCFSLPDAKASHGMRLTVL